MLIGCQNQFCSKEPLEIVVISFHLQNTLLTVSYDEPTPFAFAKRGNDGTDVLRGASLFREIS